MGMYTQHSAGNFYAQIDCKESVGFEDQIQIQGPFSPHEGCIAAQPRFTGELTLRARVER